MTKTVVRVLAPESPRFIFLSDKALSLKAKGLLSQVFASTITELSEILKYNNEPSDIRLALLEIEELGYLDRSQSCGSFCKGEVTYLFANTPKFLKGGEKHGQ